MPEACQEPVAAARGRAPLQVYCRPTRASASALHCSQPRRNTLTLGYRLSPGTVYPVLHELEQAGYLKSRAEVVSGKQRKYYEATAEGRKALEAAKEKLRELAGEVLERPEPSRRSSARTRTGRA